jgi:acetyltransferase
LAICPYPSHLVFEFCLKDGTEIKVRPIKPEDEPLMAKLFYSLSEETIRFRFMQFKRAISHEELVRYCQIDYDRELALVALVEGDQKEIVAVVRLIKRPDERSGELAIVVSDQWQGKGLGSLLMGQMMLIAKELGLRRVEMEILQENFRMLKLAEKFGFKIESQEEDLIKVVTRP